VFRNIIGVLNKADAMFPIKIEDLLRDCTSKAKYIEYLKTKQKQKISRQFQSLRKIT